MDETEDQATRTEQKVDVQPEQVTDERALLTALIDDLDQAGFQFDADFMQRFVASLLTKRLVILTGVTGSGKTRLAQTFASWLSPAPRNPSVLETPSLLQADRMGGWLHAGMDVPADQAIYRVDAVDSLSVQFSNERKDGHRIKVTLPNGLIEEWVATIRRFGYTREMAARTIREQVAQITEYSTQLNSFETHLKAAAFAVLEHHVPTSFDEESPDIVNDSLPVQVEDGRADPVGASYSVVAVGADWSSSDSVLGFPDALQPSRYVRTPTLDLILRAHATPGSPHFLILDEMNLSHVERYFSDILSSMESGEPIHLHSESGTEGAFRDGVPPSIGLPDNLFIIGTVNIDETTYMFSPKVLDRANTIEFRVSADAIEAFLASPKAIDLESLSGRGARFASSFLKAARDAPSLDLDESQTRVNAEIALFFTVMADHGSEFGFRTALEISRFIGHFRKLSHQADGLERAVDAQIYQKVLPRLSGSRAQLEPVLRSLLTLCQHDRQWQLGQDGLPTLANRDAIIVAAKAASESPHIHLDIASSVAHLEDASLHPYPLSESKIRRMLQLLRQNGFTSFAEA